MEDLERNRRNDSDVGAAERLSSLERRKRSIIKTSASADTLLTEDFLEAGGSSDCLKKGWRKPTALLLRLAILFGLSAIIGETFVALLTGGH